MGSSKPPQLVDINRTGFGFELTAAQAAALAPLFDQLEAANVRGEENSMVIAQVWHLADGTFFAQAAWIPEAKATLMKAALYADGGLIVRVDRTDPEGA
jgi:hypothetical protein